MKLSKSLLVAVFAVGSMIIGSVAPAVPVAAESSAALSIVPRKDYTLEPGKSAKDTLVIRNLDDEKTLNLTLRVVDFSATDEGGTPKLMLAEDAPQTPWSLKPFLTVPKTVSIPPKGSTTLNMGVDIPTGHGAGSYYSAIVYSSGASDGGNVGLSASGVTLVFTSVPGKVDQALNLEKFGAYHQSTQKYTKVTTTKPDSIAFTLKNSGNVVEAPVGSITLKNMFGQTQVIGDVNPNRSLALIGQTRIFTPCIKLKSSENNDNEDRSRSTACTAPDLWPGRYTAELGLTYGWNGNMNQEVAGKATFWYLPWWFIAVTLAVLAILTYFIRKLVLALRGDSRRQSGKRTSTRRRK